MSAPDLRRSNRLRWRCYANSDRTRMWIGRTSGHVVACLLIVRKDGRFRSKCERSAPLRESWWVCANGCSLKAAPMWRHRRKLVESQAAERNRLLKVLETANIKLANVATDVFGVSGQNDVASSNRKSDPPRNGQLAKGLLRKKIPELQLALKGKLEERHRFLLELQPATTRNGRERPGSSGTTHRAEA